MLYSEGRAQAAVGYPCRAIVEQAKGREERGGSLKALSKQMPSFQGVKPQPVHRID